MSPLSNQTGRGGLKLLEVSLTFGYKIIDIKSAELVLVMKTVSLQLVLTSAVLCSLTVQHSV